MLIVNRKDSETIERLIRRYRRKHKDSKLRKELRDRKHYTKPSVERRNEILNAIYRKSGKWENGH